jgi:pyruvate dehydrogenase E2 component (dihydrolipoamide acetyltransferase)
MPSLGADMKAGTLLEWRIRPGDRVKRGDIVAVVETDKGAIDIEVFETGVVEQVLVPVGEKVAVGTVLAVIGGEGGPPAAPTPAAEEAPSPVRERPPPAGPISALAKTERLKASPAARRRAGELGVSLETLSGTGPAGAITLGDVERATQITRPAPRLAADRHAAMRQAIAAAMARSKREIPHYYMGSTIDMSRAMRWLQEANEPRSVITRLLYAVLLIKAVALALRRVPELNGHFIDGALRPSQAVHLGMAISLRGGGLVAPALHHVDKRSLDDLMAGLRDLVQRARAGSLRSSEMSDATVTVTSLGEQRVDTVYGVIYPPQVALVGFGSVRERPWSVAGKIEPRLLVEATLAADHRASDGHRGGLFLTTVDNLLQEPEKL